MIVTKIVCDCCETEMKSHVYFIYSTGSYLKISTAADMPDHTILKHVCGAECATKMISRWLDGEYSPGKKRETNGNHDTARSGK